MSKNLEEKLAAAIILLAFVCVLAFCFFRFN